jgi:hypothetical protein
MRPTILALALVAVTLGAGCGTIRAQAGIGVGLGVDVQIPAIIHTGFMVGTFDNVGPLYMRAGRQRSEDYATLLFWHYEAEKEVGSTDSFGARADRARHSCWGIAPPISTYKGDDLGEDVMPYSFEIGMALIFCDFRIGFNPVAAFY